MAIEKFRFVSPGVQINEIDDSILAPAQPAIGPVVIGTTAKGPAMQPVQVSSVAELERVFGAPSNGNVGANDVWRSGVPTAPTLATYAAKAFLANSSPVTVMRLAGVPTDTLSAAAQGGWETEQAYQLYAVSGSDAVLVANVYSSGAVELVGESAGLASLADGVASITIDQGGTTPVPYQVSFDSKKTNFIRNVLNTNPSRYNNEKYFLGESYEFSTDAVAGFNEIFITSSAASFYSPSGSTSAQSGYVVGDLVSGSNTYNKLFKFEGLNNGSFLAKDIKISIENVKPSRNLNVTKYGTFDVAVRKLFENSTQTVLERFSGVSLDATSDNYIVKAIGDSYRYWNSAAGRYLEDGTYANRSAYVRVVMSGEDIAATDLPHGFEMKGMPTLDLSSVSLNATHPDIALHTGSVKLTAAKATRFGLVSDAVKNADLVDILAYKADSSDDVLFHTRHISSSATEVQYLVDHSTYHNTAKDVIADGTILGFSMPMYGGFDAKDITQAEPFVNNTILSTGDENSNPAYRAIKQAIDMVAEAEVIDMNTLVVPGLQNDDLTNRMLEVCKTRGDAQAIIDLPGDYVYAFETGTESKPTSVTSVVTGIQTRAFDNSYGAAYFPAVFVPSEGIFMPASIAALGAIGGTEGRSALWFAPAGFNRGGLTEANSGISVSRTALHLTSADRDALYENNINPIATFPNEGVVIFGQKTLQATPSALDRVNVRRLVNYIKKQISRAATRVVFEPNVENTWRRFKGVVDPFLLAIKNGYGLDDAKVVLDETTTTADLIDRNIMYCKVYIKPTRAIEYIAIDFVVTNAGSAFTE